MYCKNCGYENDDDSSFCENCGASLLSVPQKTSGMSKTNKILIIVVIVLIAGIGLAAGTLFLMSKNPTVNTTLNNSTNQTANPQLVENNNVTNTMETTKHPPYNGHGQAYMLPDPTGDKLRCPDCGSNNWRSLYENGTHTLWLCQYCGNQWWEPIPAEFL